MGEEITPATSSEQTGGAASPGPATEPAPETPTAPPGPAPAHNEAPTTAPERPGGLSDEDLDRLAERLNSRKTATETEKKAPPAAPAPTAKPKPPVTPEEKPATGPGGDGGDGAGYGNKSWFDRSKKSTGKAAEKNSKE